MATDNQPATTQDNPPDSYDTMSTVFDELGVPAPVTDEPPTPTTPPVETPKAQSEEPEPEETPPEETPPDEAPKEPEVVDWKARFEELDAKVRAQEPPAEPEPKQPPPPPEPEIYNEADKTFLTEYEKEWPDIVKGEALRRRGEYNQIVKHIFSEVQRVWGPLLERGSVAAETVAENTAVSAIRDVHADYDAKMYEDVVAWSKGLTGMRRKLADATITEGEPEDVIDLITEFKSATGRSKPRAVEAAPTGKPAVTNISAAAKKAASAMGVVDSKRTAVVQAADPNDFDAAWEEALGSK